MAKMFGGRWCGGKSRVAEVWEWSREGWWKRRYRVGGGLGADTGLLQ